MKTFALFLGAVFAATPLLAEHGLPNARRKLVESLADARSFWTTAEDHAPLRHSLGMQLMRWDLLSRFGDAQLSAFAADSTAKIMLKRVLSSRELLETFLYSGELLRPYETLKALVAIVRQCPDCLAESGTARIALACALEYGKSRDDDPARAVACYAFFAEKVAAQTLDPGFETLPPWAVRVVAGAVFSNPLLTLSSLRWLHENERGSAADYAGRVRSSLPAFRPGANAAVYGDNKALFVKREGSTACGACIYAAAAASAMGIPAVTLLEPGCASARLWNGREWVYMGRGQTHAEGHRMQWRTWAWGDKFDFLLLAQRVYGDERAATLAADYWGAAARLTLSLGGNPAPMYNKALRLQPLHVGLWREYLRALENTPEAREKAVEELNRTVGAFSPPVMGAVLSDR